jgi:uncharacterized protein YdhG (YjbR/CyaY superfamily)
MSKPLKKRPPVLARAKSKTHDAYLAILSPDKRDALQKLRRDIKAALPDVEECISYGIPAFRLDGKLLVYYGVGKNHCSFYPGSTIQSLKANLRDYDTSKGTIRFSPEKPLPASLVRKLVNLRISQRAR